MREEVFFVVEVDGVGGVVDMGRVVKPIDSAGMLQVDVDGERHYVHWSDLLGEDYADYNSN